MLWALIAAWPLREARLRLIALPETDFAMDVKRLREADRVGEAMVVAESLARTMPSVHGTALDREWGFAREARESWLRKVKDGGWGALTGRGTSGSALAGAMAGDLVAVGDVRDLVIEGAKKFVGAENDPVIAALSSAGLATTLAPPVDWVPSLLKWARRNGALGDDLGADVVLMVQDRSILRAGGFLWDVASISHGASPGGALTILSGAHSTGDVSRLAAFVSNDQDGAAALILLHDSGGMGASAQVGTDLITNAPNAGVAAAREGALVLASRRGSAGRVFLQSAAAKPLLGGHPLVRLAGGIGYGHPARRMARAWERAEHSLTTLTVGSACWVALEGVVLCGCVWRRGRDKHGPRSRMGSLP